jgi:leucyl aminopeptidase
MKKNFFYVSAITLSLVLSSCGAKSEEKETTETPAVEAPIAEKEIEDTTTEDAPVVEEVVEPVKEVVKTKPAVKKPVENKETVKTIEETGKKIKEEQLKKETFKNVESEEGEGKRR